MHAVLDGWKRRRVRGQYYPGVIALEGGRVEGRVWNVEFSAEEMKRLDEFEDEGGEYRRDLLEVEVEGVLCRCWVYTYCFEDRLEGDWSLQWFEQNKTSFPNASTFLS